MADGSVAQVDSAPNWAKSYWLWKGAQRAPWLPALAIKSETKKFTAFNTADPGNTLRAYAPSGGQTVQNEFLLHGVTIAQASPGAILPGLTCSWSPFAMGALAFMTPRGRLQIIDSEGRQREVPGTSDVYLPAWSEDGTRIAYLSAQGNRYVVNLVSILFPGLESGAQGRVAYQADTCVGSSFHVPVQGIVAPSITSGLGQASGR
jgi:hypothetical protein